MPNQVKLFAKVQEVIYRIGNGRYDRRLTDALVGSGNTEAIRDALVHTHGDRHEDIVAARVAMKKLEN